MQISSQQPRLSGGEAAPARPRRAAEATLLPAADSVDLGEKTRQLDALVDSAGLDAAAKSQLYRDLSAIPSRLWKILGQSGLIIVTVNENRHLGQTQAVKNFAAPGYAQTLEAGRQWLTETVVAQTNELADSELARAMWDRNKGPALAEALRNDPRHQQLGFEVGVARNPIPLSALCDEAERPRYEAELRALNGDLVQLENGELLAREHVFLLPYPRCQGVPVRPDHARYLESQHDEALQAAMGTNYWQSAVVAVHQDFLPDPAPEAGHHRVVLHEVGHALDHVLSRIRDENLGEQHRATVQRLFEQDQALSASGVQRFSSPRARENVREYFAEAVEAYLTRDRGDQHEPKPNNHRGWLQAHNPELFAYVDSVFQRHYPEHLNLAPLPQHPRYQPPPSLIQAFEKPYRDFDQGC